MLSYTKIERQLLLYEIIYLSQEVEMADLMKRLDASKKTIERDMKDLTDAGLVKLIYSRKEKTYQRGEETGVISEPIGTRRYMHLKKIQRLTIFMEELSSATNGYGLDYMEYNCKNRYFELFPEVSERTRMRDYKILSNIGYRIEWNELEQRHYVEGHLYQVREKF